MKKFFNQYLISWIVMFVSFNLAAFIYPSSSTFHEVLGINKYDSSFWIGYVTIIIAFIGQFLCTYKVFKDNSIDKLFYKLPVLDYSYGCLVATTIVGLLTMAIKAIPDWVGVILCAVVLGVSLIVLSKARASGDIAYKIREKVERHISVMKDLTAEVERLLSAATTDEHKRDLKALYEAFKYSDPMSTEKTADIEVRITRELKDLGKDYSKDKISKIISLMADRNRIIKSSKN